MRYDTIRIKDRISLIRSSRSHLTVSFPEFLSARSSIWFWIFGYIKLCGEKISCRIISVSVDRSQMHTLFLLPV